MSSFDMPKEESSLRSDKSNSITKGSTDVNKKIDFPKKLAVIEDEGAELNEKKKIRGKKK